MSERLNIAFIWHMHQPLYKDPLSGEYVMPWVLLHGTKDYFDMAAILDEFPSVHQTFNIVPSLIEQIEDYSSGRAVDRYIETAKKAAGELKAEDKAFILKNFFHANRDNMIKPFPRYWELLRKRGGSGAHDEIQMAMRYFREQDLLDLQVLFNLAWIDPSIRSKDVFLKMLEKKGRGYNEAEKIGLLKKQSEITGWILPKYREMMEKGIVELSTSPYYHPILPLLCDSHSAKAAMPDAALPLVRFQHPEDAEAQLKKGLTLFERTFGRRPNGLWPPEGSVSLDMLGLVRTQGIRWIATDEEILSATLRRPIGRDSSGNCTDPHLYRPYTVDGTGDGLSVLFRDHFLSDLIGFEYAKAEPDMAASDLVSRLERAKRMLDSPASHIVPIILDGENAWENYRSDGRDFLVSLYSRLNNHPELKCSTVSEFLAATPSRERLQWLFPGSWINHNFKVWIGHHEDNTAWDYISAARTALMNAEESLRQGDRCEEKKEALEEAWNEIYASEGSDWFWWYGDEHSSACDEEFDMLFRHHLKKVYSLIGKEPPAALDIPILTEEKGVLPETAPAAYLKPVIDGEVTNYFEWLSAGKIKRVHHGGSMHMEFQCAGLLDAIYYGFSNDELFLRLDYLGSRKPYRKKWEFRINFLHPGHARIEGMVVGVSSAARLYTKAPDKDEWEEGAASVRIASDDCVEFAIPLSALGAVSNGEIRMFLNVDALEEGIERWPVKGMLVLSVPSENFDREDWYV
ncbi:MAG: hypothetical protein HY887_09565 [Deltaproteobacteria bacterium]|nr:hypothetical protein [Deltaproteobacteria bacterium]